MKVDRLVSIIMILLDKERIGAQELADMFEVSPRTIYRDIDTINMAGIPVRGASGVGGGFEIMQKYKIDRKVFSTADLSAILMGLSSLSGMIRGDELVNALVVTEVQALERLSGVQAMAVAGGGIGGCEGARAFVMEGTEEQVKKAFHFVKKVHDEPPVELGGKIETNPHRLPEGL